MNREDIMQIKSEKEKWRIYESEKAYISVIAKSSEEYERMIVELCKRLRI